MLRKGESWKRVELEDLVMNVCSSSNLDFEHSSLHCTHYAQNSDIFMFQSTLSHSIPSSLIQIIPTLKSRTRDKKPRNKCPIGEFSTQGNEPSSPQSMYMYRSTPPLLKTVACRLSSSESVFALCLYATFDLSCFDLKSML
jgi:hypothetical protein